VKHYADAMVKWVEHLMALGADGVFVDQFVDHGTGACFGASSSVPPDRRHPHEFPDPDPNAPSPATADQAYRHLLSRVRDAVKMHRPDGLVIGNTFGGYGRDFDAPDRFTSLPDAYWKLVDVGFIESYFYPRVERDNAGMPMTTLDDAA
jgi:hypothetical protein